MPPLTRLLAPLALLLIATPAIAADDISARVPKEANVVLVAENPRRLVEALRGFENYKAALRLPALQPVLASPAVKRFEQLLGYYEREVGSEWPAILDRIAGNGVVLAFKAGDDNAPALLVVRGRDEAAVTQFRRLAERALEDELARQTGGDAPPPKLVRKRHGDAETTHLGDDLHYAQVGSVFTLSNKLAGLHAALDLRDKPNGSLAADAGPAAAKALQTRGGAEPVAWAWYGLTYVKESKAAKDFFEAARKEVVQTLLLGGTIDAVRRSDFVSVGLFAEPKALRLSVRLPAKRADLPTEFALHVPPTEPGKPAAGSLLFLEPPGVLYSQSFYLDLAALWKYRDKLFNPQALKDVEKFDADVSKVLPGPSFGKLLDMTGPHHRFVAVAPRDNEKLYSTVPDTQIPPAALVSTLRDPKAGEAIATGLRAIGAIAMIQFGVTVKEEDLAGVKLLTYRFAENKPLAFDPDNVRFHFAPSFAVVGDSLVFASRPSLAKDIVAELRKPADPKRATSEAVWRGRTYGTGAAAWMRQYPEPFVANAVLSQGIPLTKAKAQVAELAGWLAASGHAGVAVTHGESEYEFSLSWVRK